VKENHPSAMYSSGIEPENCTDLDSMLEQVSLSSCFFLFYPFKIVLII
jgi:hypothetical protein